MKRRKSPYCTYSEIVEGYRLEFVPPERLMLQRSRRGRYPAYIRPDPRGAALFLRQEIVDHIAKTFSAFPDMISDIEHSLGVKATKGITK